MTRKSMAQNISRMSVRQRNRKSMMMPSTPLPEEEVHAPPLIPPIVRHFEALVVLVMWIGFLPAATYLTSTRKAIVCTLALVLVIALLLHAYIQRPSCTEATDADVHFIQKDTEMLKTESENLSKLVQEDHRLVFEEWRLVFFLLMLLSSLGAAIGIGMGGDAIYHIMTTPGASKCSVSDLATLQQHYAKVWCQDGFVDVSQEVSFYRKEGIITSAYAIYRMAPVYRDRKGSHAERENPVAWVVTKNQHMTPAPCSGGLCGLFLHLREGVFVSGMDREIYEKLKTTLYDKLKGTVEKKFGKESIPVVLFTDPSNPQGLAIYLIVGIVCYVITLLGIVCLQVYMLCEPSKKGEETSYNLLDRESLGHPFVASHE